MSKKISIDSLNNIFNFNAIVNNNLYTEIQQLKFQLANSVINISKLNNENQNLKNENQNLKNENQNLNNACREHKCSSCSKERALENQNLKTDIQQKSQTNFIDYNLQKQLKDEQDKTINLQKQLKDEKDKTKDRYKNELDNVLSQVKKIKEEIDDKIKEINEKTKGIEGFDSSAIMTRIEELRKQLNNLQNK